MVEHSVGFVLGLIAGEGCFSVTISVTERGMGVYVSPTFKILMSERDRNLLEAVRDITGQGKIRATSASGDTQRVMFIIHGWDKCRKFARDVETAARESPFKVSYKWGQFKRWKSILDTYSPPQTEQELRSLLQKCKKINDTGEGLSVEEWLARANV